MVVGFVASFCNPLIYCALQSPLHCLSLSSPLMVPLGHTCFGFSAGLFTVFEEDCLLRSFGFCTELEKYLSFGDFVQVLIPFLCFSFLFVLYMDNHWRGNGEDTER